MAKRKPMDLDFLTDEEYSALEKKKEEADKELEKAEIAEYREKLKVYLAVVKEVEKSLKTHLKETVLGEKDWDISKKLQVLALMKGYANNKEMSKTQLRNLVTKIEKGITEPRKKKSAE